MNPLSDLLKELVGRVTQRTTIEEGLRETVAGLQEQLATERAEKQQIKEEFERERANLLDQGYEESDLETLRGLIEKLDASNNASQAFAAALEQHTETLVEAVVANTPADLSGLNTVDPKPTGEQPATTEQPAAAEQKADP